MPYRSASAATLMVAALLATSVRAQDEPFVPVQASPSVAPDALTQARAAAARGDAAEALSRYLRVLASRPDDPAALTGAGRAALEVGDVNAAAGFLARAEARDPRNGEVKAGLAVTLLQRGDARGALRYFREAVGLGIPVASIAADRGLAYDLRGDQRRAQADYQLALAAGPSDETVRRLALSQAIAGERDVALATLDPLLRRQNVPAWRARAFVFALTGDPADALTGAALVMPRDQLDALAPYLPRLAALKAGDKAAAIHLGRFPGEASQPTRTAAAAPPPAPATAPMVASVNPYAQPLPAPTGSAAADTKAREEALANALAEARARAAARSHVPAAIRARAGTLAPPITFSLTPAPAQLAQAVPVVPADPDKLSSEAPSPIPAVSAVAPVATVDTSSVASSALQPAPAPPSAPNPAPAPAPIPAPVLQPAPPPAKPAETRQQRLEEEHKRKADAAAKKKAAEEAQAKAEERKAKSANPARHWVQVAGGANKRDLGRAWDDLKAKWPKQLAGRAPWTTHYRFTNRLLIGPFASSDAAQDWVGERRKEGFATFRVETSAGDAVERVRD